jgi:hypothetical protein
MNAGWRGKFRGSLCHSRASFSCPPLSATPVFQESITSLPGAPTVLVNSDYRPVPLEFEYSRPALEEKIGELVEADCAPIYLVLFSKLTCAKTA